MQREEALSVLGLEETVELDAEDITDAYMEKLLPVKQYWLVSPIIAVLFRKRLASAAKLNQALNSLGGHIRAETEQKNILQLDALQLVANYEAMQVQLKQAISASWTYSKLEQLVEQLIVLQHEFESLLVNKVSGQFEEALRKTNRNEEVKIAEQLPSITLNALLKKGTALTSEEQFMLFTEVYRIEKSRGLKK